jgi:hypothetical protein
MRFIFNNSFDTYEAPYRGVFDKLLNEIDTAMQKNVPLGDCFRNCFWISLKYYKEVKELALEKAFADESDEIGFFREVKPKFTCFMEFFVMCSDAVWVVENGVDSPAFFWKEELEKYSRFRKRHFSFIDYYESGRRVLDEKFFLRATADSVSDIYSKMFDENPPLHSSKDWVVRSYLAHKMYHGFVMENLDATCPSRIEKLNMTKSDKPGVKILL